MPLSLFSPSTAALIDSSDDTPPRGSRGDGPVMRAAVAVAALLYRIARIDDLISPVPHSAERSRSGASRAA